MNHSEIIDTYTQKTQKLFEEAFRKYFDDFSDHFSKIISDEYQLDQEEIKELISKKMKNGKDKKGDKKTDKKDAKKSDKKTGKKEEKNSEADVDMEDLSHERLLKCNRAELQALCRKNEIPVSGTKQVLTDRLLDFAAGKDVPKGRQKKTENSEKTSEKKEKKSAKKKGNLNSDVIKKLTENVPTIPIRSNAYGNLEHPETNLVFNKKTKKVYGKQQDDGEVAPLTDEDIETCKKFKFSYTVPENLDENEDEVKIEEFEDDEPKKVKKGKKTAKPEKDELDELVEKGGDDSDEDGEDEDADE